jgi:hypothetical protein
MQHTTAQIYTSVSLSSYLDTVQYGMYIGCILEVSELSVALMLQLHLESVTYVLMKSAWVKV